MDGYAVPFRITLEADLDNPVSLEREIEAVPVNTGDPLPPFADAVIMVEDVEEHASSIVIRKPAYLWQHVRMTGEDVIEADILFPANYRFRTFDLGLLLASGITEVWVRKKPKLLIIPTGHELIDLYEQSVEEVGQDRLIDFNSYTLSALGREMGFEVEKSPIARSKDHLREIVDSSSDRCDVLVINAGSSAGREDFTEAIIRERGRLVFHGVTIMPGKPTMFGIIDGKPVFGIPGYPVSAVVGFTTFLQPLSDRLCRTHTPEQSITCVTPYKMASTIGVEEVLRVNLVSRGGRYYAYPLPRGASVFSSLSRADAIVRIPENIEGYDEDEEVRAVLLRPEHELQNRLHIVGSHDLSLDVMRDMIKTAHPAMDLLSAHVGSLSGIIAVRKGVIDMATTHILDEQEKVYNIPAAKKYLGDKRFSLIHIARRTQGLVTAKGNPRAIKHLEDIARKDVKFINRQVGSGTRILLDMMLKEKGIHRDSVQGYDREEPTHASTAILVREGIADVGLAIYAVARIFNLDFIPITEEEYDLLVTDEFMSDPKFTILMDLLTSAQFTGRLNELGGYTTKDTGKIKYVNG
jgi:putative molybdopterin biosynthesis protein